MCSLNIEALYAERMKFQFQRLLLHFGFKLCRVIIKWVLWSWVGEILTDCLVFLLQISTLLLLLGGRFYDVVLADVEYGGGRNSFRVRGTLCLRPQINKLKRRLVPVTSLSTGHLVISAHPTLLSRPTSHLTSQEEIRLSDCSLLLLQKLTLVRTKRRWKS